MEIDLKEDIHTDFIANDFIAAKLKVLLCSSSEVGAQVLRVCVGISGLPQIRFMLNQLYVTHPQLHQLFRRMLHCCFAVMLLNSFVDYFVYVTSLYHQHGVEEIMTSYFWVNCSFKLKLTRNFETTLLIR